MIKKISAISKKFISNASQGAEIWRLKIATHPKVIIWRLKIFGYSPFVSRNIFKISGILIAAIFLYSVFYVSAWRAPRPFPDQALVTVERGESLGAIARSFEENHVVLSSFWLKIFMFMRGGERRVIAGDYYFPDAVSVFTVAKKLSRGEFGLVNIKITVPEGTSSYEMAKLFEKELPAFNSKDFLDKVQSGGFEGYLFPDTYFFTPNTKADEVILTMRENFARQIKPYEEDILKSKRDLDDLVIMASIVEDEANSRLEAKRIVAGILWKRLSKEMPLQVDSPFVYYSGKNSFTLTKDDLAEDHPYNTYVNKGLPPTAITNPGIDSLRAAIAPTNTEYLYFLSDKRGGMHYARDFEEHKANKDLYIN